MSELAVSPLVRPKSPKTYYSVAAKGPMLDRVYSLRYRSYSGAGFISECNTEKFMDEYDGAKNCTSYLTYRDKKLIGSIRACVYDPLQGLKIPVMEVFQEEIEASFDMTRPMVEANKFVVAPEFQRRGGISARFHLFRNILEKTFEVGAEVILAAVRAEHIDFYKSVHFNLVCGEKEYPHLSFKTALMAYTNIEEGKAKVWKKTTPNSISVQRTQNDSILNHGAN